MTDIFFSYSSKDRDRVRPIHDALVRRVFRCSGTKRSPPGRIGNWIRRHLTQSKCAIVFWSATSVGSDNVRHEAVVAKQQGKLVSILALGASGVTLQIPIFLECAS